MNILVINGSPKGERSNTLKLANAFTKGIKDACTARGETATVQTIDVSRKNIKPCLGCFSCWKTTPGTCCIKDDMQSVLDAILWADSTVWSFPLYYFNVPGSLKTLIDRQLPLNLPFMSEASKSGGHPSRYDMSKKKTVLISTCGFYTSSGNYESVTEMFDRFCGKNNYASIFCGQGELFAVKELSNRTDRYLSSVVTAGSEYATNGAISAQTVAKLKETLYERDVFEKMADASWGIEKNGEKSDESLIFTRQMAALYNKNAYNGKDIILDMDYTDIKKKYRIILSKDSSRVTEDFSLPCTLCIHTPYSVWNDIGKGKIEGSEAMMKHLYTVEGDFSFMLKWDEYFGATDSEDSADSLNASQHPLQNGTQAAGKTQKTSMLLLLIPWMTFWIAAPIQGFLGSIASIFVCAALPMVFYKNKKTLYDTLSFFVVSICGILLLLHVPAVYVMPLSYLLFGVMWSASCFTKIPLTAHYSLNDYGGEKMLGNVIFLRTNVILTAAWGVLYLLTPVWTFIIMKTHASGFIGAINSVLPLFMGIFTTWFQKWYPAKVARGK